MTAEIPRAPRTLKGIARCLAELESVRTVEADTSEPLGKITVRIPGVGVPPSVMDELAFAGLTITHFEVEDDLMVIIEARRVYRRSEGIGISVLDSNANADVDGDRHA